MDELELNVFKKEMISIFSQKFDQAAKSNRLDSFITNLQKFSDAEIYYSQEDKPFNDCINWRRAKILVIGSTNVELDVLKKCAKNLGIDPIHIEWHLDYKKNKSFDFSELKYNINYSDIIFGPLAHKSKGIDGYSSAIAMMQEDPSNYPKIIRAIANKELKISKQSFAAALKNTQFYQHFN